MEITAIILILSGYLAGLWTLKCHFIDRHIPKRLALFHAYSTKGGFIVLLAHALTTNSPGNHWLAIMVFTIAIVIGRFLYIHDRKHKAFPLWAILSHAFIAFAGVIVLLAGVLG